MEPALPVLSLMLCRLCGARFAFLLCEDGRRREKNAHQNYGGQERKRPSRKFATARYRRRLLGRRTRVRAKSGSIIILHTIDARERKRWKLVQPDDSDRVGRALLPFPCHCGSGGPTGVLSSRTLGPLRQSRGLYLRCKAAAICFLAFLLLLVADLLAPAT